MILHSLLSISNKEISKIKGPGVVRDQEVTPEELLGKIGHDKAHKEGDMSDGMV